MIFVTRMLTLVEDNQDLPIAVEIFAPAIGDGCWECRFKINWPEAPRSATVRGVDGMQALYLAMQQVALELYHSSYHAAGQLRWEQAGAGYGFPIHKDNYDDLEGRDRETQIP